MAVTVTVSQLNTYAASVLRGDQRLKNLIVKGEISNFVNYRKSGHFYFTLKEGGCAVKSVMFSRYASQLRFMPEDGMSVYVSASADIYERDGTYQLYVTDILPDGAGAAHIAAEQLKAKLSAEGVFDESKKKPIPRYPKKIGVVTSREAAALRDILNIISRRYPIAEVVLFPCAVQGKEAPPSVCKALKQADEGGCDVIICGRGGGSAEDLSAFDTEEVARAIHGCNTPVISAVGHETDTTVADYAADLRAPTPSAAAELATPMITELFAEIDSLKYSLVTVMQRYIADKEMRLVSAEKRLELLSPSARLGEYGERLSVCEKRLREAVNVRLDSEEKRIMSLAAQLDALSPLKILSRGYAAVYKDGKIISSAEDIKGGDRITVRFSDGERTAVAD